MTTIIIILSTIIDVCGYIYTCNHNELFAKRNIINKIPFIWLFHNSFVSPIVAFKRTIGWILAISIVPIMCGIAEIIKSGSFWHGYLIGLGIDIIILLILGVIMLIFWLID
jgi:hypothetical protein